VGLSCFLCIGYPEISLWRGGNARETVKKGTMLRVMEFNNSHMIVPLVYK